MEGVNPCVMLWSDGRVKWSFWRYGGGGEGVNFGSKWRYIINEWPLTRSMICCEWALYIVIRVWNFSAGKTDSPWWAKSARVGNAGRGCTDAKFEDKGEKERPPPVSSLESARLSADVCCGELRCSLNGVSSLHCPLDEFWKDGGERLVLPWIGKYSDLERELPPFCCKRLYPEKNIFCFYLWPDKRFRNCNTEQV